MAKRITEANRKLFREARRHLVGGVDSPVRSFNYVGGEPVLIESGDGADIYDYDGNKYIDYCLSWGAMILGHRHPEVAKAAKKAIDRGSAFGTTNEPEIELAAAIKNAIPFISKVRFVNSGTEAVMGAVRLARGYTGREKIVKFANSYHGHADYLLAKGGSGLATLGIPSSAGVPKDFTKHTIVAPLNDLMAIENVFKKDGRKIAAVLVEPVGGNYGVLPPNVDFLKKLRRLTTKYGALLIFDEVITGFRFGYGSAAQGLGIVPDLICLGKIIGGGLPIGAYGGPSRIMDRLAPSGNVYQASTFSGNPIVMEAGLATLKALKKLSGRYESLSRLTQELVLGIRRQAKERGVEIRADHYGSMFSLRFGDRGFFSRFHRAMLERGVYLAPSEYEADFLSFSHSQRHVRMTIEHAGAAIETAKGR